MTFLVGNKVDLNHMQAVKTDSHFNFASENNLKGFYCSAKTGDQVTPIFLQSGSDTCRREANGINSAVVATIS